MSTIKKYFPGFFIVILFSLIGCNLDLSTAMGNNATSFDLRGTKWEFLERDNSRLITKTTTIYTDETRSTIAEVQEESLSIMMGIILLEFGNRKEKNGLYPWKLTITGTFSDQFPTSIFDSTEGNKKIEWYVNPAAPFMVEKGYSYKGFGRDVVTQFDCFSGFFQIGKNSVDGRNYFFTFEKLIHEKAKEASFAGAVTTEGKEKILDSSKLKKEPLKESTFFKEYIINPSINPNAAFSTYCYRKEGGKERLFFKLKGDTPDTDFEFDFIRKK